MIYAKKKQQVLKIANYKRDVLLSMHRWLDIIGNWKNIIDEQSNSTIQSIEWKIRSRNQTNVRNQIEIINWISWR